MNYKHKLMISMPHDNEPDLAALITRYLMEHPEKAVNEIPEMEDNEEQDND